MTAAATAVLARANVLGISLVLGKGRDGTACLLWRGLRGAMTEDLKADLTASKADLMEHLKAERKAEIMAEFSSACERLGKHYPDAEDEGLPEIERQHYPDAEDEGLPEIERQLQDLYAVIERLEWEVDTAAVAYHRGSGSLQRFLSALAAWERGIVDGVAALAVIRSGKLCTDCGAESPVTVLTTLGQRICSACSRSDAIAVRRVGPQRRLSP